MASKINITRVVNSGEPRPDTLRAAYDARDNLREFSSALIEHLEGGRDAYQRDEEVQELIERLENEPLLGAQVEWLPEGGDWWGERVPLMRVSIEFKAEDTHPLLVKIGQRLEHRRVTFADGSWVEGPRVQASGRGVDEEYLVAASRLLTEVFDQLGKTAHVTLFLEEGDRFASVEMYEGHDVGSSELGIDVSLVTGEAERSYGVAGKKLLAEVARVVQELVVKQEEVLQAHGQGGEGFSGFGAYEETKPLFKAAKAARIGKPVGTSLYIHRSALGLVPGLRALAASAFKTAGSPKHDLVKFDLDGTISFTLYDAFDTDAHPAIVASTVVRPDGSTRTLDYSTRDNPAVLHRKELFVGPDYALRGTFEELTRQEEEAGLLTPPPPGNRRQWEALVSERGYTIEGHQVHGGSFGAQTHGSALTSQKQTPAIFKQVEWRPGTKNLDLGGGRYDLGVDYLKSQGVESRVVDPYQENRLATNPGNIKWARKGVDSITIANVLNVIDDRDARIALLQEARSFMRPGTALYVGIYEGDKKGEGRTTKKDSWQNNQPARWYEQEIKEALPDCDVVLRRGFFTVTLKGKGFAGADDLKDNAYGYWLSPAGQMRVVEGSFAGADCACESITGAASVSALMHREHYRELHDGREHVWLLVLDDRMQVLDVLHGGVGARSVALDLPTLLGDAQEVEGATGVLLVHNHPSGGPAPSSDDMAMTTALVEAAEPFRLAAIDHVILTAEQSRHYSCSGATHA